MSDDTHSLVLAVLDHAMALAHTAIFEGPDVPGHPYLVEDLCSMLGALDFLLREYRNALGSTSNCAFR